jgi:hypothetical protein
MGIRTRLPTLTFTATLLAACSGGGGGGSSAPAPSVPGAPTSVKGLPGSGVVTVVWTAPPSNGSAIWKYTVTASPGGATADTSGTSAVLGGLANGTPYTFTVVATNTLGAGPASSPSPAVTPSASAPGAPGAPTNVTAAPGGRCATVTWTAPASTGGSPLSGYTVRTSPATSQWTVSGTTAFVGGLTSGATYTFTVTATNATNTSVPSASPAITLPNAPAAPTNVVATPGNRSATVTWSAPTSDLPVETYQVSISPYSSSFVWALGTTSATVSGLAIGTAYTFRVAAYSEAGTGPASAPTPAIVPFGVPGAPTNVVAVAGNAQATLTWTAPQSNGSPITSYLVTASPGGATATSSSTGVTFTGLTNGTAYSFSVVAVNAAGNGPSSAPSTPVTPAGTGGGGGGGGGGGTCQASLATDPSNCGATGHSCLGGTCAACLCQPQLVATDSKTAALVVGLGVNGTDLYWLDENKYSPALFSPSGASYAVLTNTLYRVSKATWRTVSTTNQYWDCIVPGGYAGYYPSDVSTFVMNDTSVNFFLLNDQYYSKSLTTGASYQPQGCTNPGGSSDHDSVANSNMVFYAGNSGLVGLNVAGGTRTGQWPSGLVPTSLAVNDQYLYLNSYNANAGSSFGLVRVTLANGTATSLVTTPIWGPIAIDATDVFFFTYPTTTGGPYSLMRVPAGGGTPALVASVPYAQLPSNIWGNRSGRLLADGQNLYWSASVGGGVEGGSATIYRVPVGGGSPTAIVTQPYVITQLAQDAQYLYWAAEDPTGGSYDYPINAAWIYAVAK